jgi:Arm DNA-binding domain
MARQINRLSHVKLASARTKGLYADGGGLYLQVASGGSKSWIFRFKANGRARDMGLGPLSTVSLAKRVRSPLSAGAGVWKDWTQ